MEVLVFLLPFFVSAFLLIFFREQTTWWEHAVLIVPSLLVGVGLLWTFKRAESSDTEYLGSYVTKLRYYEPWNERVAHTRTYTDSKGNTHTETYYVTEEHSEKWAYSDHSGRERDCSSDVFSAMKERLAASPVFVDMHRDYDTRDGDAYDYPWDGRDVTLYPVTREHEYENKVKASRSVFKFEDISKEEARRIGLYDYPEIWLRDQCPILGAKFSARQERAVRVLNARYGPQKQFRLYLLFFRDKPISIVEKQRSYWQGGNKNELVVCVGLDRNNRVMWSDAFSWCDSPVLAVKSRDWFMSNRLDLCAFVSYIEPIVQKEWKRKDFSDFKYVSVELSDGQYWIIVFLMLLLNVGLSVWIVGNNYRN